jgi:pimeloyl-ACP methyl ester carboxylesterase
MDDDARKYISELPDYGSPVTIGQLIHHTAGVRDWSSLMLFAGKDSRYEHHFDNDDVLALICRQKSLEYLPGSQYRYSSSGYVLLTEVIERVTGQSLVEFADEQLFTPLGLEHTFFDASYATVLPDRVESYRRTPDGRYERWLKLFDLYGDGGLITTVNDLAKWSAAFHEDRIAEPGIVKLMTTRGKLNSGEEIDYAMGLHYDNHREHATIRHNGGMLGYVAEGVHFPDLKLSVVVCGNTNEAWITGLAYDVADVFLPNGQVADLPAKPNLKPEPRRGSPDDYCGYYWNSAANFFRRVWYDSGNLWFDSGDGTRQLKLHQTDEYGFNLIDNSHAIAYVSLRPDADGTMTVYYDDPAPSADFVARKYDPTPPSSVDELTPLVGAYESDELPARYEFAIREAKLTMQINDGAPVTVFPPEDSRFIWNSKNMLWIGYGEIVFTRQDTGVVDGFTIGDARVSGVKFARVSKGGSVPTITVTPIGDNPDAGRFIDVGDAQIYYEVYGVGPPLLLLHGGLYGYISEFNAVIPELSKSFRVIAVATRGHGRSEIGSRGFSYRQFAEDAAKVLEKETTAPAYVIGFSDGARTAYHLAAFHPGLVRKVVGIGSGHKITDKARDWARSLAEVTFTEQNRDFVERRKRLMREPHRWTEFFNKLRESYVSGPQLADSDAARVSCELLLIGADADHNNSPLDIVHSRDTFGRASLAIVPNCDHVGLIKRREVWSNLVLPFLAASSPYVGP